MTDTATLARWDAAELVTCGAGLRQQAEQLAALHGRLRGAMLEPIADPTTWRGVAAGAFRNALTDRVLVVAAAARGLDALASTVTTAGVELTHSVQQVRDAQHAEASVLGALVRVVVGVDPLLTVERHRTQQAAEATHQADLRFAALIGLEGEQASALLRSHDPAALRSSVVAAHRLSGADHWLAVVPSPGTDPEAVATWWGAHTTTEQQALIHDPARAPALGNLDGIPFEVRDRVNRSVLARRRAEGVAGPVDQAVERALSAGLGRARRLLTIFEPSRWAGKGRAAMSVGDPDRARNVAYLVPGLDASVTATLPGLTQDAQRVVDEAGPQASLAVVAWLGYQTPTLTDVASTASAHSGADLLAHELAGLQAWRGADEPHLTLVGHSYGSTTAAASLWAAAADRLATRVDDLVVLGSPGLLASSASQVPVAAGHLWVGAASGDPVSHLGWFGEDPAQARFGARRFEAEDDGKDPLLLQPWQHVRYLDPGSEALAAVVDIVRGTPQGIRPAPGRRDAGLLGAVIAGALGEPPGPTLGDPESARPARPLPP